MKIYSIHFNKPEYICFQYDSLKKYINFEFEFIILDNSIDNNLKLEIRKNCIDLDIKYVDCQNKYHYQPSISHQNGLSNLVDIVDIGDTFMILKMQQKGRQTWKTQKR